MMSDHTERNAAMAREYRAGDCLEDIGKRYGVTRERVRQILERLGVQRRSGADKFHTMPQERQAAFREAARARAAHIKGQVLVPALADAMELVRQGRSYSEAARALGISRNQVAGICHRHRVKSVRPRVRKVADWPAALIAARDEGLCAAYLARRLGVTNHTVAEAMRRHGIQLPDGVIGLSVEERKAKRQQAERAA